MGFVSTALAFAAGYAVRANRDSDVAQQIATKVRETTSQKIRSKLSLCRYSCAAAMVPQPATS